MLFAKAEFQIALQSARVHGGKDDRNHDAQSQHTDNLPIWAQFELKVAMGLQKSQYIGGATLP
jgi:hypothetical protein